jgi:RecA/RadA recombinase
VASSGCADIDRTLGGGWRRGELSEVVGTAGTGRTSLMLATLAEATRRDELVALVDAVDRFDPASAAEAGVDLHRLLWVRGPSVTCETARPPLIEAAVRQAIRAGDLILRAGGFGVVVIDLADITPRAIRMLPHTTWLRLAHANEGRDTACVLVGDGPMGRSARGAAVRLAGTPVWTGQSAQSRRLRGLKMTMAPAVMAGPVRRRA